MSVHESGEMYLEAILVLSKKNGFVRSIDVSEYLGYSKPSVSRAVGILKSGNYITMDKDGLITLTESGMTIERKMFQRHKILTEVFVKMGVDPETAAEDACKIEHDLSQATFDAICRLAEHIDS